MINFIDVTKPEDLQPYAGAEWKVVADNKTYPGKFLNEQGEVVSSHHKGKIYNLIGKVERERGFFERAGRIAVGLFLGLMLLPLLSASVRNLFSGKEIVVFRDLSRDANPNQQVLDLDVAKIASLDLEALDNGKYNCTAFVQVGQLQSGEEFELDETEIKDILNLLPSALPGKGDRDAFAKLNYLKV